MDDARLIPADHLHAFVVRVIERVGTPTDIARVVATTIVNADLSGHPSHGVAMIPHYLAALEDGRLAPAARPVIVQELPGSAVIDAQGGWGHYTAAWTMDWLIEKARGVGVACASIRDVKHIGRLGEYAEQAAAKGCVGIISVAWGGQGVGVAAPHGGRSKSLGTNPLAVGAPTGDDSPFVADLATTTVAAGKVYVARDGGEDLPPGCIIDRNGYPATDPEAFFDGGALSLLGGHKGYALSLVTCVLAQLNGEYDEDGRKIHGAYMQAIDISAFQPLTTYQRHVRALMDDMKAADAAPGFDEVLVPGEPERRARDRQHTRGVELPGPMVDSLRDCAHQVGVDPIG